MSMRARLGPDVTGRNDLGRLPHRIGPGHNNGTIVP